MNRGTDADGTDELSQVNKDDTRIHHSRFVRHTSILVWKSYLQRQRRWRYLLCETLFAVTLFMAAIYIAFPVFIIPLQVEPEPPLKAKEILASLPRDTLVGFAPSRSITRKIMTRAAVLLNCDIINATSEDVLHNQLLELAKNSKSPVFKRPVIWVIWSEYNTTLNIWKFAIRSSKRARYETMDAQDTTEYLNPHLHSGFLAVQLAISQAIVEHGSLRKPPKAMKTTLAPWREVKTENKGERSFTFYSVQTLPYPGLFLFEVRVSANAFIILSKNNKFDMNNLKHMKFIIEIFIGYNFNQNSSIRKENVLPDKITVDTPGILSDKEFRGFWVRWDDDGNISVGREGEADPFMSWRDPKPFPINYVGISTAFGVATWKIRVTRYETTPSSDEEDEEVPVPKIEMKLVSMPISPLMQEHRVRQALSIILLCFTLALIPPVIEIEALVVNETTNRLKKSLRIHSVDYSSMYLGWIMYAHLTAIPICFLAAITLILIFRWIHLVFAMLLVLAYLSVMIMTALIMAMFHSKAWISCVWSTLFTLVLTYLAELVVHHQFDEKHTAITFLLHVFIPPLGLVNAFNSFALLQTGRIRSTITSGESLALTIGSWSMLILIYFGLLMLMQRTVRSKAIGGQVSWKSIIFKKTEDVNNIQLRPIETPTGREHENLQEVDEHVAKAISFRNVSKNIMGEQVLNKITLDVYRGEYTMFFCERVQERMVNTIEDLLTGLTFCDEGTIHVLGQQLGPEVNLMNTPHMMGYCHWSNMLIDDLTVEEHLIMYLDICLWQESRQYITEYGHMRERRLLIECNLEGVKRERVSNLTLYYRAQLCWALASLLEPRVVIIPNFVDHPAYVAVIRDKIMNYKKYLTMVNICFASIQIEFADRVFVFDSKIVAFGGTPAYMFFKYGREYRLRLTVVSASDGTDDEATSELISRAATAGATVRAHYGSLLILRLPITPTELVADLVQDFTRNANAYNITSLNITVADSEEVYKRCRFETRTAIQANIVETPTNKDILRKIAEPRPWKRKSICSNGTHLRSIIWKVFSFHVRYRLFMIITMTTAITAGILLGLTFCTLLSKTVRDEATKKLMHRELLTMESVNHETVLLLRSDDSDYGLSIANAYVLSEPNMTAHNVSHMSYTGFANTENLTEYLITRAIDSPQVYGYLYAYGVDLEYYYDDTLKLQVLYSPLHIDKAAASRSMAKAYTSLLRHYAARLDATIQVTDDPLVLDLTPLISYASQPPLLVQFLLILSVAHVVFLPSKEHGLIRHVQIHARNFSPARYWLTLYFCDLVLYWMLMIMMTSAMFLTMYFAAPHEHFYYDDILVVPFMLIVYGVVCIPQAYLFSCLGPRVALNVMTYIIVNLILGETTVLAKIFYGNTYSFALLFMNLSPQFNMVYAIVKIKQIFLYNSECVIFEEQELCSNETVHKCCETCGILQECFKRKSYLGGENGISLELISMGITTFIYLSLLLLIEYKVFKRIWNIIKSIKRPNIRMPQTPIRTGANKERRDVTEKIMQLKFKTKKMDTFGEYLLAHNVSKIEAGFYTCYNVYLGLRKGDVLALSGLKRDGRLNLCDIMAGYDTPSYGTVMSMSRWKSHTQPHMFARNISYSNGSDCLPPWMTIADALEMIALMRGVPKKYAREEVHNHIEVLELKEKSKTPISRITSNERTRLNFAGAVIGAPPIIVLDEWSAYQKFSVRRVMYYILYHLRKQGHAILISASDVESHMPITNKLAIMLDGMIYDVDTIENMLTRHSEEGYTVVVHLKKKVGVQNFIEMFKLYFNHFSINDSTEVLVNVQVREDNMDWNEIFQRMEILKNENQQVYSYIITAISIDYIYNSIINNERGNKEAEAYKGFFSKALDKRVVVSSETLGKLVPFEQKYDIIKLKELPWSVIFSNMSQ